MKRDASFAVGETYHLFNRGAHKQVLFKVQADYKRFLLLLYLANTISPIEVRNILRKRKSGGSGSLFEEIRDPQLVDIYGYSLMPNHFHLVLREKVENGITRFCRKLLTGYSMYFNALYDHSGILSQGVIKSRHIANEAYFRYIFAYIHLNPLSLCFSDWTPTTPIDSDKARQFLNNYPYSSFYDYSVESRPEKSILASENVPDFLKTQNDLEDLLVWVKYDVLRSDLRIIDKNTATR